MKYKDKVVGGSSNIVDKHQTKKKSMLKHAKAIVARSLDSSEKKPEDTIELVTYSKSATELVHSHQETIKVFMPSSNFLQLPGERSRRPSTVSFTLLEEEKLVSLEELPSLSRVGSGFSRVSDLLSPSKRSRTSKRPSIFSRLSDLANGSTRPSSLYSSLSDLSKNVPNHRILNSRLYLFVIFVIVLVILVTVLLTHFG